MAGRLKCGHVFALLVLLVLLSISPADAQSPLPVVTFDADRYRVNPSEPVTLDWNLQNIEDAVLVWPDGRQETLLGPGSKTILFPGPGDYAMTLRALFEGGEKQISIVFRVTGKQPQPVCTPPVCPAGAVLRCPDGEECPGGCGMVCMGPTRIWWVRGNVRDTIVGAGLGGVTVTCEGGTVSASTRSQADGTFDLTWQAPADAVPGGRCEVQFAGYNPAAALLATSGADGSYQLQFALEPIAKQNDGEWAINYVAGLKARELGLALGTAQPVTICARKFEHGGMLWRSGVKRGAIVSLVDPSGGFSLLDDTWDQHASPSCAPPSVPGLHLPDRGLGWAWCVNRPVRDTLGYSTEPQEVCDDSGPGRMQDYQNGRLLWVPSWNQVIYLRWENSLWYPYDFSP